jgi:ubiquinone/menaquinone biosynthesis C-methylase UbiE
MQAGPMDLRLLASAYDRSATTYDERFRALQRVKFRAAAPFLAPLREGDGCLDAGGGTGLFAEWLHASDEPHAALRKGLRGARLVVLDASAGMLRVARERGCGAVAGDLARPPLRAASLKLIVAFTSILDRVPQSLRALSALLAPGGRLIASFLADEAPAGSVVARETGLVLVSGAVPAGQDRLFALERISP